MDIENTFTELFEQQRAADAEMLARIIAESMEEENADSSGDGKFAWYSSTARVHVTF